MLISYPVLNGKFWASKACSQSKSQDANSPVPCKRSIRITVSRENKLIGLVRSILMCNQSFMQNQLSMHSKSYRAALAASLCITVNVACIVSSRWSNVLGLLLICTSDEASLCAHDLYLRVPWHGSSWRALSNRQEHRSHQVKPSSTQSLEKSWKNPSWSTMFASDRNSRVFLYTLRSGWADQERGIWLSGLYVVADDAVQSTKLII